MWQCRKCGRPVFFAERKQSLGFDWHPNCLRCEECGKRLNPGQHAEHKGVPYCHHPCYGALFGPQLFGHGTRNECHTSFGKVENRDGQVKRSHLEASLKVYNQYYEGKPGELKSREANGRMILEGVLKIYWGVRNVIHLKEEDDQRTIAVRRRSTASSSTAFYSDSDDEEQPLWREDDCLNGWRTPQSPSSPQIPKLSPMGRHTPGPSSDPATPAGENGTSGVSGRPSTSPHPATASAGEDGDLWGTRDQKTLKDLSAVAEGEGGSSLDLPTTPREDRPQCHRSLSVDSGTANSTRGRTSMLGGTQGSTQQIISTQSCDSSKDSDGATRESNGAGAGAGGEEQAGPEDANTPTRRAATKTGSTAIRRRPGRRMDKTKLKRRCSINGHFYLRETSTFTPPHGSPCSVWVTSLVTVEEVLNMLLEKYRVEMSTRNFALFVIKDNGERRRIREEEYPLITRVMLGPHEDVARVFIVDAQQTEEISPQVAQFLNLSLAECRAILGQYEQEEVRQIRAVRQKYEDLAFYIQRRMKELRGV